MMTLRVNSLSTRLLLGAGLVAGSSLLASHAAHALNGPQAIDIDGGPLGQLELSGGVDGFFYGQTGTDNSGSTANNILGDTSNGANLGGLAVHLRKTTGIIQFNVLAGLFGGAPALGTAPGKVTVDTYPISPFKVAYATIAPPGSPVTFSAGQVPSLEGYEDGLDFNNSNIFASSLWYVENSASRGVSASFNQGPFSATVTFGDGWDTGVFNFLQGIVSYNFNENNNLNVYYGGNLSRTGLHAQTYGGNTVASYGSNYINSQTFGAYYSYTSGNLNLVPEVQYVYAKADPEVGIKKYTANFGAVVLADYAIGTSPYSIGGLAEYFNSVGTTSGSQDYWFIAPGAKGVGFELTPTWQYKHLFARVSGGYLYLTNNGSPAAGYGDNGTGKDVFQAALEAGLLF
jgi:hypothetical protein